MVFDPPNRRDVLVNLTNVDIDIEGEHPVQGLLLEAWIADRLNWALQNEVLVETNSITFKFLRMYDVVNITLLLI